MLSTEFRLGCRKKACHPGIGTLWLVEHGPWRHSACLSTKDLTMNDSLDRLPDVPSGDSAADPSPATAVAPEPIPGPAKAAGKPANPAKQERRKPTPKRSKAHEREFIPNNKHPIFEVELPLRTDPATRVFEATFEPAQNSFFHLQVILPRSSALDTSMLETVMEFVEQRFTEIETEMGMAMDRLNVLKADCGAKVARQYVHAETLTVQVMTPMFERFLSLVVRMDEIMQLVDSLWFARRLTDRQRSEVINQWRNRLIKFNREVNVLKQKAAGHAERVRADAKTRDEKRAAKAAERLQKKRVRDAAADLKAAKKQRGSDVVDVEKGAIAA